MYRISNCKSTYRNFGKKYIEKDLEIIIIEKSEFKQKLFHEHYCTEAHQGIQNWSVTLTDQVEHLVSLRKTEPNGINSLNTWAQNGLHIRDLRSLQLSQERNFLEKTQVLYLHTRENVF